MVATIAPLEAIFLFTPRPFTDREIQFLDRGANCLLKRKFMFASDNPFNSEEREDEEDWLKFCFPRFYLYDVLRGLSFILKWATFRNQPIPISSIEAVVTHLETRYPTGEVCIERHSYDGITTKRQSGSWNWKRLEAATHFELLDQVSQIGLISPFLTNQWSEARKFLKELEWKGLLK